MPTLRRSDELRDNARNRRIVHELAMKQTIDGIVHVTAPFAEGNQAVPKPPIVMLKRLLRQIRNRIVWREIEEVGTHDPILA